MESVDRKPFRAVRKSRVSKGIVDQIRELISSGRIHPRDPLPAEWELAQTFHVGRSTVREAIRTMECLGFVEVRSGDGTFLAGLSSSARPGPDPITATLFKEWSTQLKVFEVRAVLESGLASMAAKPGHVGAYRKHADHPGGPGSGSPARGDRHEGGRRLSLADYRGNWE